MSTATVRADGPHVAGEHVAGHECPGCLREIRPGEAIGILLVGPGGDEMARKAARLRESYDGVGVAVHWACLTGGEV